MIKYLIVSAVIYFVVSRFFMQRDGYNNEPLQNFEKRSTKKEQPPKDEYVEYEEVE